MVISVSIVQGSGKQGTEERFESVVAYFNASPSIPFAVCPIVPGALQRVAESEREAGRMNQATKILWSSIKSRLIYGFDQQIFHSTTEPDVLSQAFAAGMDAERRLDCRNWQQPDPPDQPGRRIGGMP